MSGDSGYQNSGLRRFGANANPYMPPTYNPQTFMPPRMSFGGRLGGGSGAQPGFGTSDRGSEGLSGGGDSFGGFGSQGLTNALGGLGMSPGMGAARGFMAGGPLGAVIGGLLGYGSQSSRDSPGYGFAGYDAQGLGIDAAGHGYSAAQGYEGSGGIGGGGFGGDIGNADAGSTGGGADTGGEAGSGGDGTGSGGDTDSGGWARGGWVTKNRLRGKNPPGPDDGYGALDVGEFVVPKAVAQQVGGGK